MCVFIKVWLTCLHPVRTIVSDEPTEGRRLEFDSAELVMSQTLLPMMMPDLIVVFIFIPVPVTMVRTLPLRYMISPNREANLNVMSVSLTTTSLSSITGKSKVEEAFSSSKKYRKDNVVFPGT